jgi:hypothetical protein
LAADQLSFLSFAIDYLLALPVAWDFAYRQPKIQRPQPMGGILVFSIGGDH